MFQSMDSKLWAVTADYINTFYQFKHEAYCVFNVDITSHDVRHLTAFDIGANFEGPTSEVTTIPE